MLEHGGKLLEAARRYGIAADAWLDLSTGVNPNGWPVPPVPQSVWERLPETDDDLENAAHAYFNNTSVLPVAGTQAAIQTLPRLRAPCQVGVAHLSYAEHAHAWRLAGHDIRIWASLEEAATLDVAIVVNPNNPTGTYHSADMLLDLHATLHAHGGWLIVDEAFIDVSPVASLARESHREGLIVLRGLGKFFGLAGARVGFVLAAPELLSALQVQLGPWSVPGPSRWIARQALADTVWQNCTRTSLIAASLRLHKLLEAVGLAPKGGTALFQWVKTTRAAIIHNCLAQQGILVRLFTDPLSLRFGLPATEAQWVRLENALKECAA